MNPVLANGHPHVFVDCTITVVFDKNGLVGFHNQWVMDRMFSGNLLSSYAPGYDPDTLTLTQSDIKSIKKGAFDLLIKSNYFQHIIVYGNAVDDIDEALDFTAKATRKGLVYEFFIPFYLHADEQETHVKMSVFDDSFYSSIQLSSILISDSSALDITHQAVSIKEMAYYMGQITPKGVQVQFKKKQSGQSRPQKNSLTISTDNPNEPITNNDKPSMWQCLMTHINNWQAFFKDILTDFGNDLKQDFWGPSLFLFLFFSFLYGIVHALGPGHGKSIVTSYFIARPGNYMSGLVMSFALSLTHASSGAIFVVVMKYVLESPLLFSTALPLEQVSYALLIIVGGFVTIFGVLDLIKNKDTENIVPSENIKQMLMVALITGMIPCPGASIILIFTLSLNMHFVGLIAILAMGIGMGITTSAFACVAIFSRSSITTMTDSSARIHYIVHEGFTILGGLIIMGLGFVMFSSVSF